MKLWHLLPKKTLPDNDNPWKPWYDKCVGMVIRAKDEKTARALAQKASCAESDETSMGHTPWLDEKYSTCTELTSKGKEAVIIRDIQYA
jgi:hypothetical protein